MNTYETKQTARKERLEARADKLTAEARSAHATAEQRADMIPFGQPILVGHHSEGRDRRFRDKIRRGFERSANLSEQAATADRRAASVGKGGISSDDPDAVAKLRKELAGLEARRDEMTATNKAWRKAGKPAINDKDGWTRIAELMGRELAAFDGLRKGLAHRFSLMPYHGHQPFEAFAISNAGANIRRIKGRIEQLERNAEHAAAEPETERMVGAVRVVENAEDNRLQLFFPGKPAAEVRAELKRHGFRWAPSVGAWQRQLNNAARYAAECVLGALAAAVGEIRDALADETMAPVRGVLTRIVRGALANTGLEL